MSETHGISIILGSLIQSSEKIVRMLVNDGLVDRFKRLIGVTGPDERLVSLFASMCSLKGQPSRVNQEMCTRKLWMKPRDRFAVGVSFRECSSAHLRHYGEVVDVDGATVEAGRRNRVRPDAFECSAASFLGCDGSDDYAPICVAWAGADEWSKDCGRLWWSAKSLGLPVVERRPIEADVEADDPGDASVFVDYVPIEHVLWVLEPERLCKAVTRQRWEPAAHKSTKKVCSFLSTK